MIVAIQTVGRKGENHKHTKAPYHLRKGNFSNEDEGTSPLSEEEDAFYTYVSVGGSSYRGQHSPSIHTEPEDHQYFEPGSSSCHNGKRFRKSSSYSSHNEQETKEVEKTKSCFDGNSNYSKASSVKDDVAISKCQNSAEVEADPLNLFPTHEFSQVAATGDVNEMEHLESCDPHESGSVEKTYNLTSVISSFMSSTLRDKQRNYSFTPASDAVESVSAESSWFQNSSLGSRDGIKKGCHGENRRTIDVISLSGNIHVHINEAKVGLDEFVSNSGEEDKDDDFHPENGHRVDSVESCMLGEREKFKETDGYKRALEEEWASRQQALKIQAEEAQHLRRLLKRRKAESMRLMDMERRQKERIEEMRVTQKKDEENMNLKEVIRAKVRKELSKLEMACQNMASLLHSFGIQMEGWPNPSPQEVQTAYKKALLALHPDRALRSDIHQQVEAEEKFKLMNRFKEKFSSVL
ncbi:uncharacterized protein LOC142522417 [Primulina tabacum]|uniref:uncharacterized protein LOC142522417 n=1 Tax=Primulina tabacum TaxID=48773 RepID=UPI003F5A7C06